MRTWGFSPVEQDEIWERWRGGESIRTIGKRLGHRLPSVRLFLLDTGGVQQQPPRRAVTLLVFAGAGGDLARPSGPANRLGKLHASCDGHPQLSAER